MTNMISGNVIGAS